MTVWKQTSTLEGCEVEDPPEDKIASAERADLPMVAQEKKSRMEDEKMLIVLICGNKVSACGPAPPRSTIG